MGFQFLVSICSVNSPFRLIIQRGLMVFNEHSQKLTA